MDNCDKNNNVSNYLTGELHKSLIPYRYWLQIYMVAVIFSNLLLLFWDSSVDLGFWENWTRQLIRKGYHDFNGDYPPIFIHWLYVVGKIYSELNFPVEKNIFLKYLTQLPVMLSHLVLTRFVLEILKRTHAATVHFHAVMLLTALNPAILFNGPIWGQIDIIPLIPVIAALFAGISERYKVYTFPLYTLALLTKFQMIAFAPVFGILFFVSYKKHLKSIPFCLLVIFTAFLPFIIANNFLSTVKRAYLDTLHVGATTMGASNVWILLTGNAAPDTIILFGINSNSSLATLFKAKNLGMIAFSIACLAVFLQGAKNILNMKYVGNQKVLANDILFYAMACTVAFFTLLPAMHERYLLPAVIVSLVYFSLNSGKAFYPIAFSLISTFNLAMAMGIKTSSIWPAISWFMLIAFLYVVMEFFFKRYWVIFIKDLTDRIFAFRGLCVAVFVISNLVVGNQLLERTKVRSYVVTQNQMALNQLEPIFVNQDFGGMQINKSANGNILSVAGKRFENGIGTHANSRIDYLLPYNTLKVTFFFELDDEVESANVIFSVWGDDNLLWQSKPVYGFERNLELVSVELKDITRLSLRVSGNGDISNDHADWIQPTLTLY